MPRPLQQMLADDKSRFQVDCLHRRFGKTCYVLNKQIDKCTANALPKTRAYYIAPFRNQAKDIAWDYVKEYTDHIDGMDYQNFELKAEFPNGARLQLLGADGYQKHRGKYADDAAFDEVSDIPPSAWREVFRPLLADRKGTATFIGTPRGRDFFHDLYDQGQRLDHWSAYHMNVYETGVIDPDEIEQLKQEMEEWEFAREFLCDWDVGAPGAFFQKQINEMRASGNIGAVPWDPSEPVTAVWNMGETDTITVLFFQRKGHWTHLIDSLREMQASVADVAKLVDRKPYIYTRQFAAGDKLRDDSPRLTTARRLGMRLTYVPPVILMDGVDEVKNRLARMRVDDKKCMDAVEAMRQFHAKYDENRRVFEQKAVVDWTKDYCASVMSWAAADNENRSDWSRPITYPETFRA